MLQDSIGENFTVYKGYYSDEQVHKCTKVRFNSFEMNIKLNYFEAKAFLNVQAIEAALLGLASLALTLANILCIVLTGIAILRQEFIMRFTQQNESPTDRETHELSEPGLIVCLCRLKEVTPDKIPQVRSALQQG